MRRTVALDPGVERLIKEFMKERGISFKEALNEAVRMGFRHFAQRSFPLGTARAFRWDKALAAAEAMEDEEITRRLSPPK